MTPEAKQSIEDTIKNNKVALFMKGTPDFPQCGFSAHVVGCLKQVDAEFAHVNVLADPNIREGIKEYSNWPTIPQIYVNGEFVGGCDILNDLFESGELAKLVG